MTDAKYREWDADELWIEIILANSLIGSLISELNGRELIDLFLRWWNWISNPK